MSRAGVGGCEAWKSNQRVLKFEKGDRVDKEKHNSIARL